MHRMASVFEPADPNSTLSTLCRGLMTADPKQRLRIQRFMVAAINYVIFGGLLVFMAAQGRVPWDAAIPLLSFMVASEG